MPPQRQRRRPAAALAVGRLDGGADAAVVAAAARAGMRVESASTIQDAELTLEDGGVGAVLVDLARPLSEEICLRLRSQPANASTPIIALSESPSDLEFSEAFGWGVDDVSLVQSEAIARRFLAAQKAKSVPVEPRGAAVVGHADRRARVVYARLLRQAGYDVRFAVEPGEVLSEAARQDVSLVITAHDLELASVVPMVSQARQQGIAASWVIAAPPKDHRRVAMALGTVPHTAIVDAFSPPENALFVANELGRGDMLEGRHSTRLLYGTTIRFRTAGSDQDEVGYSYNVSQGGLFIRSLAPLSRETEVWLELKPPRCERRVRLEGEVVWVRPWGNAVAPTVPPGFGVRLTGGSKADFERYVRGCQQFEAELSAA